MELLSCYLDYFQEGKFTKLCIYDMSKKQIAPVQQHRSNSHTQGSPMYIFVQVHYTTSL